MAILRQISLLGHPILRATAPAVERVPDPAVSNLAADLLVTLEASGGVGIAAPQVYESTRVIVVASRPNARYPEAPSMAPVVLVNPELVWSSDAVEEGWEGCLSIPGLRGLVPRAAKVGVRYLDLAGAAVEVEFEGFAARIFQHELDHLNGLFFTDRIETNKNLVNDQEYFRRFV
jgi:peptide deformylase